jgi:hypothetical protein
MKGKYKSSRLGRLKKATTFQMDCANHSQQETLQYNPIGFNSETFDNLDPFHQSQHCQKQNMLSTDMNTALQQDGSHVSCTNESNSHFDFAKEYRSYICNQEVAATNQVVNNVNDISSTSTARRTCDELIKDADEFLSLTINNVETPNVRCKVDVQTKAKFSERQAWRELSVFGDTSSNDNLVEMDVSLNDSKTFDLLLEFTKKCTGKFENIF